MLEKKVKKYEDRDADCMKIYGDFCRGKAEIEYLERMDGVAKQNASYWLRKNKTLEEENEKLKEEIKTYKGENIFSIEDMEEEIKRLKEENKTLEEGWKRSR